MNEAVLLTASICWHTIGDGSILSEKEILVSVSWMPFVMSYRRCIFKQRFPWLLESIMLDNEEIINEYVDDVVRNFSTKATEFMARNMIKPSDTANACEELRGELVGGFRQFITGNGESWIHHFNFANNVPKGTRYHDKDGEWYEAEEDALIAVPSVKSIR